MLQMLIRKVIIMIISKAVCIAECPKYVNISKHSYEGSVGKQQYWEKRVSRSGAAGSRRGRCCTREINVCPAPAVAAASCTGTVPTPANPAPNRSSVTAHRNNDALCSHVRGSSLHGHQRRDGGADRFLGPLKCFVQSLGRRTRGRLNLSLSLPEHSGH
jgi:hypothetical protein